MASTADSRLTHAHSSTKATTSRVMANTRALRGVTAPVTSGRLEVRCISLSMSRSTNMLMALAPPAASAPPEQGGRHQPDRREPPLGHDHGRQGGDQEQLDDARLGQGHIGTDPSADGGPTWESHRGDGHWPDNSAKLAVGSRWMDRRERRPGSRPSARPVPSRPAAGRRRGRYHTVHGVLPAYRPSPVPPPLPDHPGHGGAQRGDRRRRPALRLRSRLPRLAQLLAAPPDPPAQPPPGDRVRQPDGGHPAGGGLRRHRRWPRSCAGRPGRDLRWLSVGLIIGVLGEAVLGASSSTASSTPTWSWSTSWWAWPCWRWRWS